ncbi:MAG: phosphoribosyltransferase family protein [Caldisericia bacterium]|jgi:competence protein ComFC|nr:phosphoribosyltransferase family protein [Caldisericia bacterium]
MNIFDIFSFIFINECIYCGKEYDGTVCTDCRKKIFIRGISKTQLNNKLYYLTLYNKNGEILIDYLKNRKYLSIINYLIEESLFLLKEDFDFVTAVPSLKFLSYIPNHLEIFSKEFAKIKNIKFIEFIAKNKKTKSQVILSLKERFLNPMDAFILRRDYKNLIKGSKILLIDDVYTTGSTLRECEKLLMNSGANVISLVFSKAILNI